MRGYFNYLRRADQQSKRWPTFRHLPHRNLAAHRSATQPEGCPSVGHGDTKSSVDWLPTAAYPTPLAIAALCRHSPEVGAVCGKAARPVLCGGRPVTGVPTATNSSNP